MSELVWDQVGEKLYEAGVDHCVLYLQNSSGAYPEGVAWNGITSITESPSGADEQKFYADNIVYGSIRGTEDFGATIEAFTYPDEWELCDGSASPVKGVHIGQQTRKPFGLSYRTLIGNDTDGLDHGYKIHLIYNATVSPSEKSRETINESPEMANPSWEMTTTPVPVSGKDANDKPYKPTAHLIITSTDFETEAEKTKLNTLLAALYGTNGEGGSAGTTAYLPLPDDVIGMLN